MSHNRELLCRAVRGFYNKRYNTPRRKGTAMNGIVSPQTPLTKPRREFTSTQLKIFAITAMLIDHIGAIPLLPSFFAAANEQRWGYVLFNLVLRAIGRVAFPLFCFLLAEGFVYTRSRAKYALRLAAFALISEIPFDLGINNATLEYSYQNVFFTLLLGFLAMWAIDALRGRLWLQIPAALACMAAAELLHTDYASMGVGTVILFYVLRGRKKILYPAVGVWMCVGLALSGLVQRLFMGWHIGWDIVPTLVVVGLMEVPASLVFLLLSRYHGERGKALPKYLFYAFYPAHLLVLYAIAKLFPFV